ncbi:MAG: glucosamine-6-phosphate deaminase [Muribaculaceae bacterium]|nr:glucosamine-6-phosphate deaminase [Muribaculaceae bacterium]MBQ6649310.1 glucosamine-6-phosphate deaminase [Muribaculaceae bacterium]
MNTDLSSHIKLDQVSKRYYRPTSEVELITLTRYEKVNTVVVDTPVEGAADAARDVVETIEECVREKGRCVIGFGAGRCAMDVYSELVKLYFADKVSFSNVIAFNLSELGLGVPDPQEQSTLKRLSDGFFNKVDIAPENIHTYSSEATKENVFKLCKDYETEIDEYGGLDLVVCELTKNGGLAFNEAGSTSLSSCRLVSLTGEIRTRIAESYQCEKSPKTAVTLGISNILNARKIISTAWGESSSNAVFNTIEGKITDQYPASFLQMHHNVKLVIDLDAASSLTRIKYPWKVTSCDWNNVLLRRALVWLSEQTGKPILKLTNKDYNEYGLSELVAIYGSGYNVNIQIFNDLQHTITGWPGGKPNADDTYRPERATPYPKRVLAFSPHPDDAILAMGGTLRRLVEQGHEVHVAFVTSGDIMVNDEDLLRYMLVSERSARHNGYYSAQQYDMVEKIRDAIAKKAPGDPDTAEVRYHKGEIFVCEGITSCNYLGIKQENVHELQLPFYINDPRGKGRITQADVQPVKELIESIKPHQIFFADDLSDPFGTHEPAANVVLAAIDELKNEPFMHDCRTWMYRGLWGEWDIDFIEMAVPMSPEEFQYKRDAILKHQSQVHDAPFIDPENDDLNWQRSLRRNQDTAALYSRLGLASYEAIESFVQYQVNG